MDRRTKREMLDPKHNKQSVESLISKKNIQAKTEQVSFQMQLSELIKLAKVVPMSTEEIQKWKQNRRQIAATGVQRLLKSGMTNFTKNIFSRTYRIQSF